MQKRFIKRKSYILAAIIFAASLFVSLQVRAEQAITFGLHMNKPLNYQDTDGQAKGLVIDVFTHIAKQEGWKVTFAPCKWAECLSRLESGEIDVLSAIGYTTKRKTIYDFSETPLIANWGLVMTQPKTIIQSIIDLEGVTIAVMKRAGHTTALQALLKKFNINANYLEVDSFKSVLQAVNDKKADAGVVNRLFASQFASDYQVLRSPIIYNPIEIRYAFTKGKHREIVKVVDRYLLEMKKTEGSVYFQSLENWFGIGGGKTFSDTEIEKFAYIAGAFFIFVGVILSLLLIFGLRYPRLTYDVTKARFRIYWLFGIAFVIGGSVFVFDLMIPLGVAGAVPYVALVLVGYWFKRVRFIYILAISGSVLAVAGYFLSPPGSVLWMVLLNRGLALFAIWITALLLVLHKNAENKLVEAMKATETASRAKSNLMANVSHELRTPLNAIIGFSSTMQEELFGPIGNNKYREYLNDINHSGQHLLDLINDILDVSAIEGRALKLSETEVDIVDVTKTATRLIAPRAEHGKIKVSTFLRLETLLIRADGRRVKQIILNLLSNAVKFTPEGGKVIVDSLMNDDGSFSIFVSDTGYGMSDDEVAIAMDRFGQVDSGHDRKHEGTGLGLPLTKGLMELHGGTLEIDSLEGYGTMVTVTFPKERIINNAS